MIHNITEWDQGTSEEKLEFLMKWVLLIAEKVGYDPEADPKGYLKSLKKGQ